jgi:hypothetical protein
MWKKGTSGNPKGAEPGRLRNKGGRPKGSRNTPYRYNEERRQWVPVEPAVIKVVKNEAGEDIDCLDYCQSVVSSPVMPHRERMIAAQILAPYRHPKASNRFLSKHIDLDPPKDINEAIEQRKKIMALKRVGYLSIEDANDQIAEIDGLINVMRGPDHTQRIEAIEAQLAAQDASPIEFIVEDGLGMLPVGPDDPNIIMPPNVKLVEAKEKPDDGQSGRSREPDSGAGGEGPPAAGEDQDSGRDNQG